MKAGQIVRGISGHELDGRTVWKAGLFRVIAVERGNWQARELVKPCWHDHATVPAAQACARRMLMPR